MVGAEAENFENMKSLHCRKNEVSQPLTIFLNPMIDKLQNAFGYKIFTLGACYLQGIQPLYIAGKKLFRSF